MSKKQEYGDLRQPPPPPLFAQPAEEPKPTEENPFYWEGHTDTGPEMDLGPCCGCECTGRQVRNIVMLEERSPTPGRGWGCVVCNLPSDGAIVVMCDQCLEDEIKPKYACVGRPNKDGRLPIEQLAGRHEHNMAIHEAESRAHFIEDDDDYFSPEEESALRVEMEQQPELWKPQAAEIWTPDMGEP